MIRLMFSIYIFFGFVRSYTNDVSQPQVTNEPSKTIIDNDLDLITLLISNKEENSFFGIAPLKDMMHIMSIGISDPEALDEIHSLFPAAPGPKEVADITSNTEGFISRLVKEESVKYVTFFLFLERFDIEQNFRAILNNLPKTNILNLSLNENKQQMVNIVNSVVEKTTTGKIKDFLQAKDISQTVFMLLNIIYFKLDWKIPFDEAKTKKKVFEKYDTSSPANIIEQHVDFVEQETLLKSTEYTLLVGENNIKHVIFEKHFKKSHITMFFIKPENKKTSPQFNGQLLKEILNYFDSVDDQNTRQLTNIQIPKVSISTNTDYHRILYQKIKSVFDNTNTLRGINKMIPLSIEKIKQTASLEISEKGIEVACATSIHIRRRSRLPIGAKKKIILNSPFYFGLRIDNEILFFGTVDDVSELGATEEES